MDLLHDLSSLTPHERRAKMDKVIEARNVIVLDKAREMGIVES